MISIRSPAVMKSNIILSVFLFNVSDHQFIGRNHDNKKTIVTEGVKTKVSVGKVFWSMLEGDIYGEKNALLAKESYL